MLLMSLGRDLNEAELRAMLFSHGTNSESPRAMDRSPRLELTVDFSRFVELILKWQEDELTDVFCFFDDDLRGHISVQELAIALHALGDGLTQEEAENLAEMVDSDGSGTIDSSEFSVFMKPLMAVSSSHEYQVTRVEDGVAVQIVVSLLGVQVIDGHISRAYSFFTLVSVEQSCDTVTLTVLHHGDEAHIAFSSCESARLVENISHQQTKLKLRQDVQIGKQQRKAREVFDLFDTDGGGTVDVEELRHLMHTLGQTPSEEELQMRIKRVDVDNSGDINFDEFLVS